MKKIWEQYRHFLLLILFRILYIWFIYCEKTVVPKYIMFSPIDLKIPFVKEFVVPYLFWYIYMAFGFIYLGFVSKKDYYRLFLFIFIGMVICYTVYTVLPNGQNLRPVITADDIFSKAIKNIYEKDTPTNVAPSIHVLNSIAIHIALIRYEPFKENRILRFTSLGIMLFICASTVLIKQHSVLDVIWAIVLSGVLYFSIYLLPQLVETEKDREKTVAYFQ